MTRVHHETLSSASQGGNQDGSGGHSDGGNETREEAWKKFFKTVTKKGKYGLLICFAID